MKRKIILFTITFLLVISYSKAQHSMIIDAGFIKNFHNDLNGANVSSVYYLNKKWGLALEINRFLPQKNNQ